MERGDHAQGGPFTMSAGGRLKGHTLDADDRAQRALQTPHELEGALDRVFVLVGVEVGKPRKRGGRLVDDRVVLHGAAAKRVEVLADRVVERSEPAVVAHDLGLAEPGQARRPCAQHLSPQDVGRRRAGDLGLRQARRVDGGTAELEAEGLAHDSSTAISSSSAWGSLTSVHVNVRTSFSSRNQRFTSSPPRIPLRASLRTTERALGTRKDRKSTRLNSSHRCISYAVFCLKK